MCVLSGSPTTECLCIILSVVVSIATCNVCWGYLVTWDNVTLLCHAVKLLHVTDYCIVWSNQLYAVADETTGS